MQINSSIVNKSNWHKFQYEKKVGSMNVSAKFVKVHSHQTSTQIHLRRLVASSGVLLTPSI